MFHALKFLLFAFALTAQPAQRHSQSPGSRRPCHARRRFLRRLLRGVTIRTLKTPPHRLPEPTHNQNVDASGSSVTGPMASSDRESNLGKWMGGEKEGSSLLQSAWSLVLLSVRSKLEKESSEVRGDCQTPSFWGSNDANNDCKCRLT